MKTLAKSLGAVTLVLVVAFAYLVMGTRLQARVVSETVVPASAYPEAFASAMEKIRTGGFPGDRQYAETSSDKMEDYSFVEIRVSASSFGLLPCEWIEVRVTPLAGDIALAACALPDIDALSRAEATALVLARSDMATTGHGVWLEYYAFGAHTYVDAK